MFRSPFSNTLPIAAKYQGQGSDRWYARVNQRFLRFALADESPPEERAKRVQGRIFDSSVGLQLRRGAYMQFVRDLYILETLPNYKTYIQRCIGL